MLFADTGVKLRGLHLALILALYDLCSTFGLSECRVNDCQFDCVWKLLFYRGILAGTQDQQGYVLWKMLFFTMMSTHSKSIANNTIQVTQWDANTSSSLRLSQHFLFPFILGKIVSLIISLMNQLVYGAFENVIFQIDSTILPSFV